MFKKRKETDTPDSDIDSSTTDNQCLPVPNADTNTDNSIASTSSGAVEISQNILDVGNYVGLKDKIDDDLKYRLLDSPWKPEKSFEFPVTGDKRKLKFQIHWFDKFSWLVYTTKGQQGFMQILCTICRRMRGQRLSSAVEILSYSAAQQMEKRHTRF